MDKITITINGKDVSVPNDYTVLQAAEELGINIPRLCFLKDVNETSACRLCVVDVKDMRGLKNSCTLAVRDGMEIETDNQSIQESVVENLKLLASNHIFECWACEREYSCEFLDLMRRYNVDNVYGESNFFGKKERMINDSSSAIVLDSGKCILCGRCVSACDKFTGLGILQFNERGNETYVGPANFHPMEDSGCIYCGKCVEACPTAAIKEKSHIDPVLDALRNPHQHVIVVPAPTTCVTLGEEFGSEIGENVEGKLYTSLQRVGFDQYFDINFAANISMLEESTDLIERIKDDENLPLYTSSVPGWNSYIEQYEPKYMDHVSSAKSPQQVSGTVIKHYFAKKLGYDKEDVVVVSIVPAIEEKFEADREEHKHQGLRDVDYVLTTREYARLLKRKGIEFMNLGDGVPFGKLAELTNSAARLDASGSVMEATLHTVSELLEETPHDVVFKAARGHKDIQEATYHVAGKDINVAVVQGPISIKEFFARMSRIKKQYHYVEFLSCLEGCTDGGGNPIHPAIVDDNVAVRQTHIDALAAINQIKDTPNSRWNESVQSLYKEWLEKPGSDVAQELLHATFKTRSFYE